MRDEEFITRVQVGAGLASRDDAERAVRATVETLGELLPDTIAHPLAELLPEQLGEPLRRAAARPPSTERDGRLSRGVEEGEASWPGDDTTADVDVDGCDSGGLGPPSGAPWPSEPEESRPPPQQEPTD